MISINLGMSGAMIHEFGLGVMIQAVDKLRHPVT